MFLTFVNAQSTNTLRGKLVSKSVQTEIVNAEITIKGTDKEFKTKSDSNGKFRFDNLAPGRYNLQFAAEGFLPVSINNIQQTSGKETVLNIEMEEDILAFNTVKISVSKGTKPNNDLALNSARGFSVEETQRYAGAINDPSRMASSFPGVNTPSDGNNFISVRGNSPNALLWRMEGIDIPNPNHFSNTGAQGGGISILSAQLLSNSDFITGAFPAEYGNALGGVFDLKLRKGNSEKHERTIQLGFLGLEVAAEGPISKKRESSYLINYRNSTLSILSKFGFDLGPSTINFSDLSYHFNYSFNKKVSMSLFGFTGWSNQTLFAPKDTAKREFRYQDHDFIYGSNTSIVGHKTNIKLNKNNNLSWVNSYTRAFDFESDWNMENIAQKFWGFKVRNYTNKISSYLMLNSRINKAISVRSGINSNYLNLNYTIASSDSTRTLKDLVKTKGDGLQIGAYSSMKIKLNTKWTAIAGLHSHYFSLAKQITAEPRLAVQYALSKKTGLSASFGMHSQVQPLIVYYAKDAFGNYPNNAIKMSKASHFIVGMKHAINKDWNFGLETYYQSLNKIPVSQKTGSTLSLVNSLQGYVTEPLINKGIGKNYGIEATLEKVFKRSTYMLAAVSIYNSEYQALDKVWRKTAFNGGRNVSLTFGKEFKYNNRKKSILGLNAKLLWLGGIREMPVLIDQSTLEQRTVFDESRAFEVQLPDYFRADIRISYRMNGKKTASIIALDVQNASNRKNIGGTYYDVDKKSIVRYNQMPLLPLLSYKLEF